MKLSDREKGNIVQTDKLLLFWSGWPSQWFKVNFKAQSHIEGMFLIQEAARKVKLETITRAWGEKILESLPFETYNCCEQYMMAEKARLFVDHNTLKKIMATDSPKEQKALGRAVKDFDASWWDGLSREVVYRGNLARFTHDKRSRELLGASGQLTLVEASPYDRIWALDLAQMTQTP